MRNFITYFSYIISGIIGGILVLILANYCDFLPKKYNETGIYMQALIYGIGYAIIIFGILKQKEEWFFYNEYPFREKLLRFKYFQKKEKEFLKRKEFAISIKNK